MSDDSRRTSWVDQEDSDMAMALFGLIALISALAGLALCGMIVWMVFQ